ncbi:hypothetical protein B0J14DRAFT_88381 [Halenospora varia]|nr:hypothetical protein B0J14DRAFT_88381 [Halenospora varia]
MFGVARNIFGEVISQVKPKESESVSSEERETLDFSSPNGMVILEVGNGGEKEKLQLHKQHACHYSPVLNKAFNNILLESQTQTYTLKDTTSLACRLLVQWLYTQRFSSFTPQERLTEPLQNPDEASRKSYFQRFFSFVRLWVLADKLMILTLQNQVMDELVRASTAVQYPVFLPVLEFIYGHIVTGSPLRRLAVEMLNERCAWTCFS